MPFLPLRCGWSGRGDMPVLTAVEQDYSAKDSVLTGTARLCGFYLNELILRLLLRHDAHEQLFLEYARTLQQMSAPGWSQDILRVFEKRLLEQVGYGMHLWAELSDNRPVEGHLQYRYIIGTGPQLQTDPTQPEITTISGASLLALATEQWSCERERLESKQLLRRVLHFYLDGRSLQSRKVVQAVYASQT